VHLSENAMRGTRAIIENYKLSKIYWVVRVAAACGEYMGSLHTITIEKQNGLFFAARVVIILSRDCLFYFFKKYNNFLNIEHIGLDNEYY